MNRISTLRRALCSATVIAIAASAPAAATHTIQPGYYHSQLSPNTTIHWGTPAPDGFLYHSTGTSCSGGSRPGTNDMANYLKYWFGSRTVGLYDCRYIAGTNTVSLHGEGRAVDYHVNAFNSTEKAIGDRIFAFFRKNDTDMQGYAPMRRFGVQEVIWNCKIYSSSNLTIRTYSYCANGGTDKTLRHEDHVHIGLNREGAERRRTAWSGYKPCYSGHGGCPQ